MTYLLIKVIFEVIYREFLTGVLSSRFFSRILQKLQSTFKAAPQAISTLNRHAYTRFPEMNPRPACKREKYHWKVIT